MQTLVAGLSNLKENLHNVNHHSFNIRKKIALTCSIVSLKCKNNPLHLYVPKFKNVLLLLPKTKIINLVFHTIFGKVPEITNTRMTKI